MHSGGYYAPDTRNWWQRLLARLFPAKLVDLPEDQRVRVDAPVGRGR